MLNWAFKIGATLSSVFKGVSVSVIEKHFNLAIKGMTQ